MVDPDQLAPAELDRIEDALEWLETVDAIDDDAPRVRERLAAYRDVLVATRAALPLEEVPPGLLDTVIAEARASAGAPTPITTTPTAGERNSWWRRIRGSFLVPTLALASTAVLVLWIARPDPQAVGIDNAEIAARTDDERAPARKSSPSAAADAESDAPPPPPTPAEAAQGGAAVTAEPAAEPARNAAPVIDSGLGDPPQNEEQRQQTLEDVPGMVDLGKSDAKPTTTVQMAPGWDLIERADSARKAGDCRSAREDYMVAAEDDDPAVRARAYAGLGLCDAAAGNTDAAEENFARARGLDGSVDGIIERENAKPFRSSTRARKSSSKKKPKSKAAPSKDSPFSGM